MARLTRVHGSFPAHVMAARLEFEGFDVLLRGNVDGPYAVTVGDLAIVDLYVRPEDLEAASLILLETEVEEKLDDPAPSLVRRTRWGPRMLIWVLIALGLWPVVRHLVAT